MKKLGLAIVTLGVLAACEKPLEQQSLDELRTSLTTEKVNATELKKKLALIDSLISVADTTVKKIKTTPVTTSKVISKKFEHYFDVHGNVEVEENAALYAEAPGTVEKIHVTEGQSVRKGDLIISLDASTVESSLKELQKAYDLVNKVYEKQSKLWEQKIGSEIQYLEAKTNKESMEQKLTTVKAQLDMYKIRAPFNGIVDNIISKVGEAAVPGFPLARVLNLNKIYLESSVSENYLNTVKKGGLVRVIFPSIQDTVMARVTRTGNFINPANRTFTVRVEFSNPGGKYKPNQLAVLSIRDQVIADALVIPSRIIQQDRLGNEYVYTLVNDGSKQVVKKLSLETGLAYNGETVVVSGIEKDQVFVDKGSRSVQEKDAVEIKN